MQIIYFIIFFLLLSSFFIYASTSISSGIYLKTYCRVKTDKKVISLSFDDGPHPIQTPKVLDVLKKHNIKAVFFLIGQSAQRNPEIVKRISNEGHLIGNHTLSHSSRFPLFSKKEIQEELENCDSIIYNITNKKSNLFRPPFGVTNPTIGSVVKKLGYITIGWSIRSLDTMKHERSWVVNRVIKKAHNGGVILFHDDRPNSEIVLEETINQLLAKGYIFERIDELFKIKAS